MFSDRFDGFRNGAFIQMQDKGIESCFCVQYKPQLRSIVVQIIVNVGEKAADRRTREVFTGCFDIHAPFRQVEKEFNRKLPEYRGIPDRLKKFRVKAVYPLRKSPCAKSCYNTGHLCSPIELRRRYIFHPLSTC